MIKDMGDTQGTWNLDLIHAGPGQSLTQASVSNGGTHDIFRTFGNAVSVVLDNPAAAGMCSSNEYEYG